MRTASNVLVWIGCRWWLGLLLMATIGCDSNSLDSDGDGQPLVVDTLAVIADAAVTSELPGIAHGLEDELVVGTVVIVGGPTYVSRTLIGLPALPIPLDSMNFGSATLILTYQDSSNTLPFPVSAHSVDSAWDEATVTWFSQPSIDTIALQTVSVQSHQLRFNVAPLYIDSTFVNGIMLKSDAVDIWLESRESATARVRPIVEIRYRRR